MFFEQHKQEDSFDDEEDRTEKKLEAFVQKGIMGNREDFVEK